MKHWLNNALKFKVKNYSIKFIVQIAHPSKTMKYINQTKSLFKRQAKGKAKTVTMTFEALKSQIKLK